MANLFSNERIQQLLRLDPQLARAKLLSQQSQFFICPFTIILGTINATNSGYKDYNIIPTDYTQFSKVFDGNESVVAQWDNSVVTDKDGNELIYDKTTDESYKTLKIGDYYNVIAELESLNIQFLPNQLNQGFISEQIVKSFDARMYNIKENASFINNLQANQYKFFMIPEFSTSTKDPLTWTINPEVNNDRQFFYLKNINIIRNNLKEIIYVDLSFLSVQDQFAQSGLNLNNYIQLGSPGECVSVPKIINNTIQLDPNYLRPFPVTHAQIEFFGNTAFNNFALIGRECPITETTTSTKHRVGKPQIIFPFQFFGAQNDIFNLRKSPESIYSWVYNFQWDVISSKSFKDDINLLYNPISPRNVLGLIGSQEPGLSNNNNYNYWNTNFLVITKEGTEPWKIGSGTDIVTPIVGNKYFYYSNQDKNITIPIPTGLLNSDKTATIFSNIENKSFSNWLMFNYFCYNNIIELPITYEFQTPVAFSSIPVFGKLAQFFTFGLLEGFNVENIDAPLFSNMNYIMPKAIWENYQKVIWTSGSSLQGFPFEVFYDAQDGQVGSLLGNTATTCSFAFNLTNNLDLAIYELQNDNKTINLIRDSVPRTTLDINQAYTTNNSNSFQFLALSKNTKLNVRDVSKVQGYYIDVFSLNAVAKCNYQIKLFSDPVNFDKPFAKDKMVFIGTYQTKSKTTKSLRQIFNLQQINNPFLKQDTPFRYPKNITQPKINPKPNQPYTLKLQDQTWTDVYNETTFYNGNNNIKFGGDLSGLDTKAFIYFKNNTMTKKEIIVPPPISGYKLDKLEATSTFWQYEYIVTVHNDPLNPFTATYTDTNHQKATIQNFKLYQGLDEQQISLFNCYINHNPANFDYKDGGQQLSPDQDTILTSYNPHGSLTKKQIDTINVPVPNDVWVGSYWDYEITYSNNVLTFDNFTQKNRAHPSDAFFTIGTDYNLDNLAEIFLITIDKAQWTQTITLKGITAYYVPDST